MRKKKGKFEVCGEGKKLKKLLKIGGKVNQGNTEGNLSRVKGPFEKGSTLI